MKKLSKKGLTIVIVLACLGMVFGAKAFFQASSGETSPGDKGKVKGHAKAPVKITEFIDFQCPACAAGAMYLKSEMKKHPQSIRLELKHYPLPMHRHGVTSSQYAECALEQEKFWPFHDLLIERQGNWKRLDDAQPAFLQIAKDAALDIEDLQLCLKKGDVNALIEKDMAEGKTLGVRSTPTYFVNGVKIVGKKSLEEELMKYLEKDDE